MAVTLHLAHYRFAADSGSLPSPAWLADIDTPVVLPTQTTFHLRLAIWETTGDTNALNTTQQWQCRKNGGAWQNITTTSTICRAVTTTVFANNASCTPQLLGTHGTFDNSNLGCTTDGSSGGSQNDIPMGGSSETIAALQLQSANLASGDVVDFRVTVVYSTGSTIVYDYTPSVTVNDPSESPSASGSRSASRSPSLSPSGSPSLSPSTSSSLSPSRSPSLSPSLSPSGSGSLSESGSPSYTPSQPTYGRPALDLAAGSWTPSSGDSLFAMLNEEAPVDTTYIRSAVSPVEDTAKLRITGLTLPGPGSVTLRIRGKWTGGG